jgi:V/A-type H+-transporting ATPase subunit D
MLPSLSRLMNLGIGAKHTREDHKKVSDQMYAAYAEGNDLRGLVAIVGKDALSERDRMFLEFADLFEGRFVRQGYDEDRTIVDTLTLGWDLLSTLPVEQLVRIDRELIAKYHPKVKDAPKAACSVMALRDIKPTRSELISLKRKIQLSERGYKILKMKRDGLILEFFKVLKDAKDSRGALQERYARAVEIMALANTVEGAIGVKTAAFSVKEVPQIQLRSKNIMGVVVPEIKSSKVKKSLVDRGYGVLGTGPIIDETASAFEDLVESIIVSAEVETTMKKLLDEIEKTKRRVNALEFKVIPELTEARDFIKMRLDEMEREELFRLKKIKARAVE